MWKLTDFSLSRLKCIKQKPDQMEEIHQDKQSLSFVSK